MKSISKSKYISGLKCPKLLWYLYNAKDEIPAFDAATEARFAGGHEIGEWAKKLYPGGIEVAYDPDSYEAMIKQTKELLPQRIPIFEATLEHRGAFARADVLVPVGEDQWDMIEVKSSTKVKDYHYDDMAVQAYIFKGEGLKIRKCMLACVNNQYVRQGDIDPAQLLKQEELTEAVEEKLAGVADKLKEMQEIIKLKKCPDTKIGKHCDMFHSCQMEEVCWGFLPKHNVFTLRSIGAKAYELFEQGVLDVADIPEEFSLSDKQQIQLAAIRSGQAQVDKLGLQEFLGQLKYPLYFLDFETVWPPLPLFDGVRPYQQIPFQFSLHVRESEGAELRHHSYLAEGGDDPRQELAEKLKPLMGDKGSVLAFNARFECSRLQELGEAYPEYAAWVETILARVVDLIVPFRKFHYYHACQLGYASLKNILPAFDKKAYQDMAIADGGTASSEYARVTYGDDVAQEDRAKVREDLEAYCALDTLAMVRLLDGLQELVK